MALTFPSSQEPGFPQEKVRRESAGEESNFVFRRLSYGTERQTPSYHKDGKAHYVLPNDFKEHVRLETQAVHLSEMMNNDILHAPVKTTAKRCLDIGCGTGIVTDLMSEKFPKAECIGMDLSRVPDLHDRRSNVRFFQGNVTDQKASEWTAKDGGPSLPQDTELFDYLYSRLLILGMSDWQNYIQTEFELLKPGGWAEVQDLSWDWLDAKDNNLSDNWSWLKYLRQDLEGKKGLDTHCGVKVKQWMEDAGFVDVQVFKYYFPVEGNSEPTEEMREFGKFNAFAVPAMLHHAIRKAMPTAPPELVEKMRAEMRRSLQPKNGIHQYFYVTIGRKSE